MDPFYSMTTIRADGGRLKTTFPNNCPLLNSVRTIVLNATNAEYGKDDLGSTRFCLIFITLYLLITFITTR